MNNNDFLAKLRAKPEHVRRHIALWSSLGITIVIFVFWIGVRFDNNIGSSGGMIAKTAESIEAPSTSLMANVGSLFTDIKDIFFKKPDTENTVINLEVEPGSL